MKDLVTIKDIALKAGVSTATVSRYINNNGYVSKVLKNRIQAVIKETGFIPSQVAISLKRTATKVIGIVTPDISNVSLMDTVQAISDVVRSSGYQPIIVSSGEDVKKENEILDVLISRRVDGIIIAPAGNNPDKIMRINARMVPVVLFDRDICNKDGSPIVMDAVVNDNFNGAYNMVSHLLSLGHRNIAILSGNKDQPHMNLRLNGYCKALQDHNVPINSDFILKSDLTFENGYEKTKELFSRSSKPTAFFVLNNTAALGAVFALNELHIQIPQDISICAFGEFKYHAILNPDLTVVNQHPYEYGKRAAKVLIDKISCAEPWKPIKVVMPSDIVFRNSCAPAK